MKIISMAWTADAFLAGKKTVTRRTWTDKYARLFTAGDVCQVYDYSPRNGGRCIGIVALTCDPYKEALTRVTDDEEKAEGGLWGDAATFIESFCQGAGVTPDYEVWVVRFRALAITGHPREGV